MSSKTKMPVSVKLLALTAVTIVIWIGFDVVTTLKKDRDISINPKVLEPLTPALDSITLDKLQNRVHLEESEIPDTTLRNPDGEVPLSTENPSLSTSPEPESSPSASPEVVEGGTDE